MSSIVYVIAGKYKGALGELRGSSVAGLSRVYLGQRRGVVVINDMYLSTNVSASACRRWQCKVFRQQTEVVGQALAKIPNLCGSEEDDENTYLERTSAADKSVP